MALKPFRARVGRSVPGGSGVFGSASQDMQNIVSDFNAFCAHLKDTSSEILLLALEPTFQLSQTLVPVDTGALKESGYLEVTNKGQVEMGYGKNGSPDYAPIVHEDMEASHKHPTQAKFLQSALERDFYAIAARAAQYTKQAQGMA